MSLADEAIEIYASAPEYLEGSNQSQRRPFVRMPLPVQLSAQASADRSFTKVARYWAVEEARATSGSDTEAKPVKPAGSPADIARGYESAGNKSSPNKTPSKRRLRQNRDSLAFRKRKGKPGSRRHQRWMNEADLGRRPDESYDHGANMEEYNDEFFEDYAETPLSLMVEFPHLRKAWQPFVSVTEEQERRMLRELGGFDALYSSDEETPTEMPATRPPVVFNAGQAFHVIERETRQLLRKYHDSPFLADLDKVLFDFARGNVATAGGQYEEFSVTQEVSLPSFATKPKAAFVDGHLVLHMKDSFHRRLVHGICLFYNLLSASSTTKAGQRVTVVSRPMEQQTPTSSVCMYLASSQNEVMYWSQPPRSRPRKKKGRKSATKQKMSTGRSQTAGR